MYVNLNYMVKSLWANIHDKKAKNS